MPQVPRYTPQEQLRPLPTPRVDAEAFGSGVGRAVEQAGNRLMSVGDSLGNTALKLYEQVDQTAAKEAYAKLLEQMREKLYGENGFFAKQGKNAVDLYRDGDEALRDIYDTISGELKSERQKKYFHDMSFQKLETARDQLSRHEAEQLRVYEREVTAALITQSANDAIANYTDMVAFNDSVAEGLEQITIAAATLGLPEEAIELKKEEYLSGIHVNVIQQILASDDGKGARAWYEGHKDEIRGSVRDEIEKSIKNVEMTVWAQEQTDSIVRKFSSESQAIDWIRKNYSGEKEDKLVSYVKTRFSEKEAAEREWKVGLFDSHAKKLDGMSPSERLAYVDKLNIPSSVKDSLYTYVSKLDRTLKIDKDDPNYNVTYFEASDAVKDGKFKSYTEFSMEYGGKLTSGSLKEIWKTNPDDPKSGMFTRIKSNVHGLLAQEFDDDEINMVEPRFNEALNDIVDGMDNPTETEIIDITKKLIKEYVVHDTLLPFDKKKSHGFDIYNEKISVLAKYPDAKFSVEGGFWYMKQGSKIVKIKVVPEEQED